MAIFKHFGPQTWEGENKKRIQQEEQKLPVLISGFCSQQRPSLHTKRFLNFRISPVVATMFIVSTPCPSSGSPKVHSETRFWERLVYVGGDPRKHSEGVESEVKKGRKPTRCDDDEQAARGQLGHSPMGTFHSWCRDATESRPPGGVRNVVSLSASSCPLLVGGINSNQTRS